MRSIKEKLFYFVRHGRTDANANGLMCGGEWDIPLNDDGASQSKLLGSKVLALDPSITTICASPMIRAQQTAHNLNSELNVPVLTVEKLREWCVGDWEKQSWDKVPNVFTTTEEPPNGETRNEFKNRIVSSINQALKNIGETTLFVSHGAFAHVLFSLLDAKPIQIENAVIYKVYPKNSSWHVEKSC